MAHLYRRRRDARWGLGNGGCFSVGAAGSWHHGVPSSLQSDHFSFDLQPPAAKAKFTPLPSLLLHFATHTNAVVISAQALIVGVVGALEGVCKEDLRGRRWFATADNLANVQKKFLNKSAN